MCRSSSHGPPRLRNRRHLFGVGPRAQPEANTNRFLNGEITCGPGVAVSQTEQEIDVGGPWADAVHRCQRVMRGIGILLGQHVKVQSLLRKSTGEIFQGLDFCSRKSKPAKAIGASATACMMVERIERARQTRPYRRCARGR